MHRIHTSLAHLKTPHNHTSSIFSWTHLCMLNLLAVLAFQLTLLSLDHQYHPRYVWLIAPLVMPHSVSGIIFLVLPINLIPVSLSLTRLFLFLPHLPLLILDSCHPYLAHSFAPDLKPTSFTNLSHHRLSSNHMTDTMDFLTRPFLLSNWVFVFSCFQVFIAFYVFLFHAVD